MLELINEYISCSEYSCSLLKEQYSGNETLLRAKNLKLIAKEGIVDGMNYRFHGRGCLFEYDNDAIEVDFGPDGRCDGFDAYRLKHFMEHRTNRFVELSNETVFDNAFEELIKTGIIKKHLSEPFDHLFYLSKKN